MMPPSSRSRTSSQVLETETYRHIIRSYFEAFQTGDFSGVRFSPGIEFLSPISGETMKGPVAVTRFVASVSTRVSHVSILAISVDFPNASGVWQMTTTKGITYTLNNHFNLDGEGLSFIWPMFDPKAIVSAEALEGQALMHWLRGTNYYDVEIKVNQQPAGLGISGEGRLFITVPRWIDIPNPSVAEIMADGNLRPYPNSAMNQWDGQAGVSASRHFVCAQSVVACGSDLWILDPAAPMFGAVVEGGPKLVRVDLDTDQVVETYSFDPDIAPEGSYLNDVRLAHGKAFISDSGLGAIVVLDLKSGVARRLLSEHSSTKAEVNIYPVIEDQPWALADGSVPMVHVDGIAIDPMHTFLYYKALRGAHLHRVPLVALMDDSLPADAVASQVESIAQLGPTDGLECDQSGNIYFTDLEQNAISRLTVDGRIELVAAAGDFLWPDTITIDCHGDLLFTASQFHRMPAFHGGVDRRTGSYSIVRLKQVAAGGAKAPVQG